MTQRATLRAIDADIFGAFAAAGMADTGSYVSPDGEVTDGITYTYDDVSLIDSGEGGVRAVGRQREITLQLSEVSPVERGVVIGDDGSSWRLVGLIEDDQSMSRWAVAPVRGEGT
jgi:hypothetical protein